MLPNPYLADPLEDKSVILGPEEGKRLSIRGVTITLRETSEMSNDQLGVYDIALAPHTIGAKLHFHRFMDETFIVNEGILTVSHGDSQTHAGPGSVIYVPRFTPHGFANDSDELVRLTLIFSPAQKREGFFFGLEHILNADPVSAEDYLALYNRYDSFPVDASNMLPLHPSDSSSPR
jgi:quercetin dioxygenase-like cupin family protein